MKNPQCADGNSTIGAPFAADLNGRLLPIRYGAFYHNPKGTATGQPALGETDSPPIHPVLCYNAQWKSAQPQPSADNDSLNEMAQQQMQQTETQTEVASSPYFATPNGNGTSLNLRDFTVAFFQTFGAECREQNGSGSVTVDLSPDLAEHFGKPALDLVFQNAEVTSETDLVAYGSRVFDRMMAYLDRQGALTVQELPSRHGGADQLLRAVRPLNAGVTDLKMEEKQHLLFVFNWHITYRADDKREELYTVMLDEMGKRMPLADERGNGRQAAGDRAFDLPAMLADASPAPPEINADGQSVPPKLPPMTHLTRLAESARKYALYHADVRCVAHEAEILPRLHKVLSRLTSYYEQQIEEVYDSHDPNGEKRQTLEQDLQRKIAEEVENHRLRVQVRLFSYAILKLPVAIASVTIGDGKRTATAQMIRNRYTGALRRPRCHACGEETADVVLCRNGHLSCDGCMVQCESCQDVLCGECGVEPCPACGQNNCNTCSQLCWACGERACPEHISQCPICADTVCHACQTECSHCGTRQCRSHLQADSVSGELICAQCAVRCPGCQQASTHLETCSASGQRFCANCAIQCPGCGQFFGPGFYEIDPADSRAYCRSCLQECPTCRKLVAVVDEEGCQECGAHCCGHCGLLCTVCNGLLCPDHCHRCFNCGEPLCAQHRAVCGVGQEDLCPDCASLCGICERPHCQEHTEICALCHQAYCSECIRASGWCDTCAELPKLGVKVGMPAEPVASDPRVANLMNKYSWIRHGNRHCTLYLGSNMWGNHVMIVAQGAKVLRVRRSTLLSRLRGEGWSS